MQSTALNASKNNIHQTQLTSIPPMSLLKEIRNQPEHVRHIFMWLCVVITFSMVGFVWFKSTQSKFVAMLHPKEVELLPADRFVDADLKKAKEQALAQNQKAQSPFAVIGNTFSLLRASILELIGTSQTSIEKLKDGKALSEKSQSKNLELPLSEEKSNIKYQRSK